MKTEIRTRLFSSEAKKRKQAAYKILFERHHDLLNDLKEAAVYEKDPEIAVLMAQIALAIEAHPRDLSFERLILEQLQKPDGVQSFSERMWQYLLKSGTRQMIIAVLDEIGEKIPTSAQNFIEGCLNSLDPEVRSVACQVALNSGRPTNFAYVLNLITDPDPFVSEMAFKVVKELPVSQLAIILDYALGSPDEWVLKNVAPFLPHLVCKELRSVISKVQFHQNALVSRKAREALKALDAIPVSRKKRMESMQQARMDEVALNNESEVKPELAPNVLSHQEEAPVEPEVPVLSFKEEMELKRKKIQEEAKRKEEEDARIEAELSDCSEEEMESFAEELESFSDKLDETSGIEEPVVVEDKPFLEDLNFEDETEALGEISIEELDDSNLEVENDKNISEIKEPDATQEEEFVKELETEVQVSVNVESKLETESVLDESEDSFQMDLQAAAGDLSEGDTTEAVYLTDDESAGLPQEEASVEEVTDSISLDSVEKASEVSSGQNSLSESNVAEESIEVVEETIEFTMDEGDDLSSIDLESVNVEELASSVKEIQANNAVDEIEVENTLEKAQAKSTQPTPKPVRPEVAESAQQPSNKIKITPPPSAQTILTRYPSFLADPLKELFVPNTPEGHLKNIKTLTDNLIGYLNLCFIQSCLFFAPSSEVLQKSIKDCLKGHLIGPTSLRCLHNFSLALKQSRENPVFFTFSLARVFSESSDLNPLMMLRELNEFLKSPIEPLNETVPQAVEGLCDILAGVKSILHNKIVMKAPKGAKQPFADLSGPLAVPLAQEDRPELDLPSGEAILISREGTEALGLFPYFKYQKRKVVFNKPSVEEFDILIERLEIEV